AVHVVADRALLELFLPFSGIAFLLLAKQAGTGQEQAHASGGNRAFRRVHTFSLQSPGMPLKAGDRAPEIRSGDFQLSKLRGKRVVIFFYPKSDTPGCTKEACEFRDSSKKFTKQNTEIVGISPDKPAAQAKFATKYGLPNTFVADPYHKIAQDYEDRKWKH